MKNIVLVGSGKWGKNYISTISAMPHIKLIVATRDNWKQLIDDKPDGVIVCTPPESHIQIATWALEREIPVMIEKPLSLSRTEANALLKFNSPILVNHIHLFSKAYQDMRQIISERSIDRILSMNFNNGPIRTYSSLWDYGCHDIAMVLDLVKNDPNIISAQEVLNDRGSLFSIKLQFDTFNAESLIGNGGHKLVRQFKVETDGLKLTYEDLKRPPSHPMPLTSAINVFLDSLDGKPDYRLGLDLSLRVMRVLETCQNRILDVKSSNNPIY
jgi:Oxidoreductase family, NAD-binding Rossmann fold